MQASTTTQRRKGAEKCLFCPLLIIFILLVMGVVTRCAATAEPTRVRSTMVEALGRGADLAYAHPMTPLDFQFPADHGAHEQYQTEWWYYTGNLADEDGVPYGYQLTFFRSALTPEAPQRVSDLAASQVYMAHFALTDGKARRHHSFDRYSRGGGGLAGTVTEPRFEVWLEDWEVVQVEPGLYRLRAETAESEGVAIELELRETQPPVLHGDRGLSQKGPEVGNANYYYSLVRMETDGVINIGDRAVAVDGLSWMDHEFGTSGLTGDARGWDWFSVQLDNGAILMFGEFHDGRGKKRTVYDGTLVTPDGRQFSLGFGDFELQALGEWTGPNTGITYPAGWEVGIPEHGISLNIQPLIPDQELDVNFVYYEGATEINGMMDGAPVQGRGFVELTGYGNREMEEFQR